MCGIAGIISFESRGISDTRSLVRMSGSMARRGPDDEGYVLFNNAFQPYYCYGENTSHDTICYRNIDSNADIKNYACSFRIGFAHRRLSIIDLSPHASQPMASHDGLIWVIFNGEIYNYRALKTMLEGKGYRFRSNSDTEVIIFAYREWGIDFIQRLNGMFAIALYDGYLNRIFLIRDRLGMKPLFYYKNDRQFLFASDIKTLIASGLYTPEPDFDVLNLVLCYTVSPGTVTPFKNVTSIEPASYMVIDPDKGIIHKQKYWEIPSGLQQSSMSVDGAMEILQYELKKAVVQTLEADVEVASFLSGGLDSSLVTLLASQRQNNIKAFTLGFDGIEDETDDAALNASSMKVLHIVKKVSEQEIIESIRNVILCYEEPFTTISPTYLLASFIKENNIRVVLNGLGGDELFAGYGYYKRYAGIERLKKWKTLIELLPPIHPKITKLKEYVGFKNAGAYYAFAMANFKGYEMKKLTQSNVDPIRNFSQFYDIPDKKFTDYVEQISFYDFVHYIGKHQVYRADQFMSYFSLEGRFPFLDHELIEAVATIPSHFKITNGGKQKFLLRQLASQYFSPEIVNRPKKGFQTPVSVYMDGVLKPFVDEKIMALKQRLVFNNQYINTLISSYQANKKKIWQLVMTELWFETFFDQTASELTNR